MSWDGKNFDKPLIMLDYESLGESVEKNLYKPPEEAVPLSENKPSSEVYFQNLVKAEMQKPACDYLAYSMNKRAAMWWACQCVKSIKKEIREAQKKKGTMALEKEKEKQKKLEEKLAHREKIKGWKAAADAKEDKAKQLGQDLTGKEFTDPKDPRTLLQKRLSESINPPEVTKLKEDYDKAINALTAEQKREVELQKLEVKKAFQKEYGISFEQSLKNDMAEILPKKTPPPTTPSTMDMEVNKLKGKLAGVKQKINDQMKVFPLKIPGLPEKPSEKRIDGAYEAAMRWVLAPTDINGQLAVDAGTAANSAPEGLLAQSAFWSGTNLSKNPDMVIPPPPGLASRGIASTIYMCAMAKGGERTYEERYEEFLGIGVEVAQGINVWDVNEKIEVEDDNNWEGRSGFGRNYD